MLRGLVVNEVFNWPVDVNGKLLPTMRDLSQFNVDDTYMLIFAPVNGNALEEFEKQFKGKILFKSKKAMNSTHPGVPRNTLVIFELGGGRNGEEI